MDTGLIEVLFMTVALYLYYSILLLQSIDLKTLAKGFLKYTTTCVQIASSILSGSGTFRGCCIKLKGQHQLMPT